MYLQKNKEVKVKKLFYLFLCTLMVTSQSFAAFIEESESFMTVQNVKDLKDESPVRLKGKITKNLGDDKYSFSDNTGVIIIEIDEEDFRFFEEIETKTTRKENQKI